MNLKIVLDSDNPYNLQSKKPISPKYIKPPSKPETIVVDTNSFLSDDNDD